TFIMFTLFPISLLISRSFSALVIAFTIRGLKEFGDTSRKALIIGFSDSRRRGQMIGSYYLVRDLVVSSGAILGAYLWKLGPALNFLGAAALGMAGTIFYIRTTRRSRQSVLSDLKRVGGAAKSLELTTCRFCFFESQRCFVSWQSHWERLVRMLCDRHLKGGGWSMFG